MKNIKIYFISILVFFAVSFTSKSYANIQALPLFENMEQAQEKKEENAYIFEDINYKKNYEDKKISIGLKFASTAQKEVKFESDSLYINTGEDNNIFVSKSKNYTVKPLEKIYVDDYGFNSIKFDEVDDSPVFIDEISKELKKISLNNIYKNEIVNVIGIYDENNKLILALNANSKFYFISSPQREYKIFEVFGKKYRGGIKFINNNGLLTVINYIDIEDYLLGVVPKEMWASWNSEALKAQAIASRSFAYSNYEKFAKYGFNLTDDTRSQAYGGFSAENKNTTKAVEDTRGIVAYYNGKIAELIYNASSGGKTESAENIWQAKIPYLIAKDDPYSIGNPYDKWEVELTQSEIEKMLKDKGKDIGILQSIELDEVTSQGYVLGITFKGTLSSQSFKKDAIRGIFGYSKLKSLRFNISELSGKYKFTGSGYGHGVGMSQYGAKSMAEQGNDYKKILEFYYPNIVLEKII